jgi:hypothetical protein
MYTIGINARRKPYTESEEGPLITFGSTMKPVDVSNVTVRLNLCTIQKSRMIKTVPSIT